jgi:plastocyanin
MKPSFRLIAFHGLAVAVASFTASADSVAAPSAAAAQSPVVTIGNFTFSQPKLVVRVGTTVTWVNDDDIPHTVVARNMAFRSKALDTGDRFSFTFAKAGQFDYFCSLHPHMTGQIVVKA